MGVDSSPQNLGIRVSQPYVDVENAADKDLILSSSFPMLKEEDTGVYNVNGVSGSNIVVTEHKLGYHPFFIVWDDQAKFRLSSEWLVDENNLYYSGSLQGLPTNGSGNFRWSVYRLPIFTPMTPSTSTVQTTKDSIYNPDFGLRAVKEGKDIDSDDLRDFTIHSKGRSPLIHEVNVKSDWQRGINDNHRVDPNLPYTAIFFAYSLSSSNNKVFPLVSYGQSVPFLSQNDDNSINIASSGSASVKTSIIVFKDPFLSDVQKDLRY